MRESIVFAHCDFSLVSSNQVQSDFLSMRLDWTGCPISVIPRDTDVKQATEVRVEKV